MVRDLHLYLGLFMSPFVLVFSVSVFFIVHTWRPGAGAGASQTRIVTGLALPANWKELSGRPLIDALRPALEKAGVAGQIGYVRHLVNEEKLVVPVILPGRETTVTIGIARGEATVVTRETGLADALVTLHKFPGPHNVHANWFYMKAWRWLADATAYLFLFIAVSGVYLWYALRAERRVGLILIGAGAASFFGLAYALSH